MIFTNISISQKPQAIYTSLSHTYSQECPYPLNDSALRTSRNNMTYFSIHSTFSQNKTRTFCNNLQLNKHRISIVRPARTRNDPHTLTNPNQQPYLKYKLNTNTAVIIEYVPAKNTANPTGITTNTKNYVPPNTNDFPPTNNTRPMHRTNGHVIQHKHYINWTHDDDHHNTNYANSTEQSAKLPSTTYATTTTMSSNDDSIHIDAPSSQGRRGDKTSRGRNRGRGFHFGLNAQMALTQHLMRRGRSLLTPATDAISLTIGNFSDAPLNARRLDNNVYPTALDRDNVLEVDTIYLYHPSPR